MSNDPDRQPSDEDEGVSPLESMVGGIENAVAGVGLEAHEHPDDEADDEDGEQ